MDTPEPDPAELAALRDELRALSRRVGQLEARLRETEPAVEPRKPAGRLYAEPTRVEQVLGKSSPPPLPPGEVTDPEPASGSTPAAGATPPPLPKTEQVPEAKPKTGRLREEQLPVLAMSVAGGLALLLGLLYFTWYSIQRGWISPPVRVGTVAVLGLLALGQGWRFAGREQRAVGEALAGAGLGGWFGAILVGRHVHDFFGVPLTFGLLAAGGFLGLVVALHRRLRLLGLFAGLGAFLTPLIVGSREERFHELVTYQLLVASFLCTLEWRRRWTEYGLLAAVSTWIILFTRVARGGLGEFDGALLTWTLLSLLFLNGHVVLWIVRRGRAPTLGSLRLFASGAVAWLASALACAGEDATFAWVTLGLAVANVVFGLLGHRAMAVTENVRSSARTWALVLPGALAWLQACAFVPLHWDQDEPGRGLGWTALAAAASWTHVRTRRWPWGLGVVLPFALAFGWSLDRGSTLAVSLAWILGAWPMVTGWLLSRPGRTGELEVSGLLGAAQLGVGHLLWQVVVHRHLELEPLPGWTSLFVWLPPAVVAFPVVLARAPAAGVVTLLMTALVGVRVLFTAMSDSLLSPRQSFGADHLWQVVVLGLAAGVAWVLERGFRDQESRPAQGLVDGAGVVGIGTLVLASMLVLSGVVPRWTDDPGNRASLVQASWSVAWALGGLGLLLRGLFDRRSTWRRTGITLLFATAGKLLVVDMVEVAMVWRVLSFMGLGLAFLAGAYAYRRLGAWIEATEPS